MATAPISAQNKHALKYQSRIRKIDAKRAKAVAKATRKASAKFNAQNNDLKSVLPGPALSERGFERAKTRMAAFAHKDKILKFAAAAGIGAGVATGIYIAVGLIKVAAIGAFFASPVGHGVAIGLGVGAGLVGLFFLGKYIRGKVRDRAAQQLAKVNELRKQTQAAQSYSSQVPAMEQQGQHFVGGFAGPSKPVGSNNPYKVNWDTTPPSLA